MGEPIQGGCTLRASARGRCQGRDNGVIGVTGALRERAGGAGRARIFRAAKRSAGRDSGGHVITVRQVPVHTAASEQNVNSRPWPRTAPGLRQAPMPAPVYTAYSSQAHREPETALKNHTCSSSKSTCRTVKQARVCLTPADKRPKWTCRQRRSRQPAPCLAWGEIGKLAESASLKINRQLHPPHRSRERQGGGGAGTEAASVNAQWQ